MKKWKRVHFVKKTVACLLPSNENDLILLRTIEKQILPKFNFDFDRHKLRIEFNLRDLIWRVLGSLLFTKSRKTPYSNAKVFEFSNTFYWDMLFESRIWPLKLKYIVKTSHLSGTSILHIVTDIWIGIFVWSRDKSWAISAEEVLFTIVAILSCSKYWFFKY
jgi:hypothetical protein